MEKFEIIDAHCHIASTNFIPHDFFSGIAKNMLSEARNTSVKVPINFLIEQLKSSHQDHLGDQLAADMQAANINKSVVLMPDFSGALNCDLTIEEISIEHTKICERHPGKFILFQGIDPLNPHSLKFFESAVDTFDIKGLKLYPPCGYSPSDEKLYPYYEICDEKGLPVLLHTGPSSPTLRFDYADPMLIDRAAHLFQNVNFILAHGGVYNCQSSIMLCSHRPNIYMDIAGFVNIISSQSWIDHLSWLFSHDINHKIIFGSDYPLTTSKGSTKSLIDLFLSNKGPLNDVSDECINNIFSQNIKNILPGIK